MTSSDDNSFTYDGDEPVRINKWLAQIGVCSRREVEAFIRDGLISIDGERVPDFGRKIEKGQTLQLAVAASDKLSSVVTYVLNKPVGFVSSQPEGDQIPAARLLNARNAMEKGTEPPSTSASLAPLGRLDQDSRGLLLLSEDGVLAKAIIGPESDLSKEYLVKVTGDITKEKIGLLCHGLELDGKKLKKARVKNEGGHTLRFTLWEGRKRQIRRMCEAVDLWVVDLWRIRIGPLELNELREGKWRLLTTEERDALIAAAVPKEREPRPERNDDNGDRPMRPRRDGDRSERGDRDRGRPRRTEGDGGDRRDRPRRDFDRSRRDGDHSERGARSDRFKRHDGDRPKRFDREDGERPARRSRDTRDGERSERTGDRRARFDRKGPQRDRSDRGGDRREGPNRERRDDRRSRGSRDGERSDFRPKRFDRDGDRPDRKFRDGDSSERRDRRGDRKHDGERRPPGSRDDRPQRSNEERGRGDKPFRRKDSSRPPSPRKPSRPNSRPRTNKSGPSRRD